MYLYIDLNSFFASVEQQLNPALRGKPVGVIPVETEFTSVIAASYEAKKFGIKTGTSVREARERCPDIIFVTNSHHVYVEYHHKLMDEVEKHVHISDVCSIDEFASKLMENEIPVAAELAGKIKKGIAANIGEHVKCSIGVAPNKYLAKIACDMQKPDGLTILEKHELPGRLFELKLRDLPGVGWNMEERLHKAGVFTVEDVWNLDPKHARRIWHSLWGEKIWYLLRGEEIADTKTVRSSLGHSHVLGTEVRPPAEARKVAQRLTTKAAARMRRIGYYAKHFSLSVRVENGNGWYGETACYRAQDSATFIKLLDDLWRQMLRERKPKRIKKISVTMSRMVKADELQPELFEWKEEKEQQKKNEKVSKALDILNHKFGRDTITMGIEPKQAKSFTGTKIAFTRIPDMEEFVE